jgi:hypothetical protein
LRKELEKFEKVELSKEGAAIKAQLQFARAHCNEMFSFKFIMIMALLHYFILSDRLMESFYPQTMKTIVCRCQQHVMSEDLSSSSSTCLECNINPVEIFQAIGEFCSYCWQKKIEPTI